MLSDSECGACISHHLRENRERERERERERQQSNAQLSYTTGDVECPLGYMGMLCCNIYL